MEIKISVVIPTYNRPLLLLNCLNTLQNQTLKKTDYEIIVVSDGLDEKTKKETEIWMKDKGINFSFIQNSKKRGPASARNLGWLSAHSPLIAFTDDDCLPDKQWLASILKCYKGQEMIAYSGRTVVPLTKKPTDFALNLSKLGEANFITANCACTKAALLKVGGFDERFKMAWREDTDLEFKFVLNNIPILKIKEALVIHPIRTAKWAVSAYEQKKGIYDALLFKKYPKLYRQKIQPKPLWFYYLTLIFFLGIVYSLYLSDSILVLIFSSSYLFCLFYFTTRRLTKTSNSGNHIFEMIITSFVIPFLSVYYRFYGAIKFRILFF